MLAKKQKMNGDTETEPKATPHTIQARLISDTGEEAGPPIDLPAGITTQQLGLICNALLKNEEATPYLFFVGEDEIKKSLEDTLDLASVDTENVIDIVYQPQAVFKVRPVTRCTSSMPGHAEAVVSLNFSPDGAHLASGSGDTTVRLWDLNTETPHFTCTGHKQWVLCVSWAPDGKRLASGCKAGSIIIWDPETGQQKGRPLSGHKKHINCLAWEPYHKNPECRRLASASGDGDCRVWDVKLGQCLMNIAGHTNAVTAVRWGGAGLIYTSSKDRTVKMWRAADGILCRTFSGHAHWVNNIALSTDYVLRTGPFHPVKDRSKSYLSMSSEYWLSIMNINNLSQIHHVSRGAPGIGAEALPGRVSRRGRVLGFLLRRQHSVPLAQQPEQVCGADDGPPERGERRQVLAGCKADCLCVVRQVRASVEGHRWSIYRHVPRSCAGCVHIGLVSRFQIDSFG